MNTDKNRRISDIGGWRVVHFGLIIVTDERIEEKNEPAPANNLSAIAKGTWILSPRSTCTAPAAARRARLSRACGAESPAGNFPG
jgi:hypothetical protein